MIILLIFLYLCLEFFDFLIFPEIPSINESIFGVNLIEIIYSCVLIILGSTIKIIYSCVSFVFTNVLFVFSQSWFWVTFGILILLFLSIFIIQILMNSSNNQTINTTSNNINNRNQSLNSSQNIEWKEIGTNISIFNQNTDIEQLLTNLIGAKDNVTGEVFKPGDKAYFCVPCQLGYHEDSWEYLNKECNQCKSSQASIHTLPIVISLTDINRTNNN
jgi:hypothetical protein